VGLFFLIFMGPRRLPEKHNKGDPTAASSKRSCTNKVG
jgi:hypothetical protein